MPSSGPGSWLHWPWGRGYQYTQWSRKWRRGNRMASVSGSGIDPKGLLPGFQRSVDSWRIQQIKWHNGFKFSFTKAVRTHIFNTGNASLVAVYYRNISDFFPPMRWEYISVGLHLFQLFLSVCPSDTNLGAEFLMGFEENLVKTIGLDRRKLDKLPMSLLQSLLKIDVSTLTNILTQLLENLGFIAINVLW